MTEPKSSGGTEARWPSRVSCVLFFFSSFFFFACVVGGKYNICRAVSKTCFVNWSSVTYIYPKKKASHVFVVVTFAGTLAALVKPRGNHSPALAHGSFSSSVVVAHADTRRRTSLNVRSVKKPLLRRRSNRRRAQGRQWRPN